MYNTIKTIKVVAALMLCAAITACGESAKEKAAREAAIEQARADSIAKVEKEKAEAAEKHRIDSIAAAERRRERFVADSAARAELLPSFVIDNNAGGPDIDSYQAKGTPTRHRQNSCYLSFYVDNDCATQMFVNVDYIGQDWINIASAMLDVDGKEFPLNVGDVGNNVNSTDSSCSEWFRSEIYSNAIDAMSEAKSVKVVIRGDERSKTINLTSRQVKDMVKTISLYKAFGGK